MINALIVAAFIVTLLIVAAIALSLFLLPRPKRFGFEVRYDE